MRRGWLLMLARVLLLWVLLLCTISASSALGRALPGGDQLLVESDRRNGLRDLRLVDVGRPLMVNLTRTPFISEESAEWSRDGRLLTYIYGEVMIRDVCVWAVPALSRACADSTGSFDDRPRWSSDSASIVYQSVTFGGDVRLSLLPQDLSSRVDVMTMGGYLDYAWSPDDRHIVFTAGLNYPLLHVLSLERGAQPQRLFFDGIREYAPTFSPDGRWLAYISEGERGQDLYRIPTSCLAQAASCAAQVERLTSRESSFSAPDWSPDSRLLIYTSRVGNGFQLVLLDTDDKRERLLTNDGRQYASPRFSPDGKAVVFLSGGGGRFDVYLRALDAEAQPQRLTFDRWDNWSPLWRPRG
jgi:TolB protein